MRLFGLEITKRRPPATDIRKREFHAAKIGRLTADWTTSLDAINDDIKSGLNSIRARTRDRAKNSSWFRRYLETSQRNIIGPNGIRLNVRSRNPDGSLDKIANDILETAFADWARVGNCTPCGKLSWFDLQNLAVQSIKIDGEFYFQKVRGKDGGKYGLKLQPIDAALCNIQLCETTRNGNNIIQGVEVDKWGRPQAYHFCDTPACSSAMGYMCGSRRVPASEIIHGYVAEAPGQVHGVPDSCAALTSLHMLDKVSEAEVTAVRIAAAKMGFYMSKSGDDGTALADDQESDGELITEATPGTFSVMPKDYDFKEFDPKHPTANYPSFVKCQLREIAAGLRLAYNDFSNDLEGVNFSSIRSGTLAEHDSWMMQQAWFIDHLCRPVYSAWLEMFLLSGVSQLPMAKADKFMADNWLPRRWQWVDPLKDAQANIVMRQQGWKSDSQIVAEQGADLDEVQDQIFADSELKKVNDQKVDELNIERIAAAAEEIAASGVPALHWSHIVTIGGAQSAPGAYLDAAIGAGQSVDATTTSKEPDNAN